MNVKYVLCIRFERAQRNIDIHARRTCKSKLFVDLLGFCVYHFIWLTDSYFFRVRFSLVCTLIHLLPCMYLHFSLSLSYLVFHLVLWIVSHLLCHCATDTSERVFAWHVWVFGVSHWFVLLSSFQLFTLYSSAICMLWILYEYVWTDTTTGLDERTNSQIWICAVNTFHLHIWRVETSTNFT